MNKKKLDITGIKNELEGASLHFRRSVAGPDHAAPLPEMAPRAAKTPPKRASRPPALSISATTRKSSAAAPLVDRPASQLTGRVVERPVSFYIPEVINEKIDEAVEYINKRHGIRVDRSAVVSAILGSPALWEPDSLNQLVDQALSQLTSRLTSRLTNRPVMPPGRSSNGNPLTEVEMRSVP